MQLTESGRGILKLFLICALDFYSSEKCEFYLCDVCRAWCTSTLGCMGLIPSPLMTLFSRDYLKIWSHNSKSYSTCFHYVRYYLISKRILLIFFSHLQGNWINAKTSKQHMACFQNQPTRILYFLRLS